MAAGELKRVGRVLGFAGIILCFCGFAQVRLGKLATQSGPFALEAGVCSPGLKVVTETSSGVIQAPGKIVSISTRSSDPSLSFYSDSSCHTPVNALPIGPSVAQGILYFLGGQVGTRQVVLSADRYQSVTQVETLFARPTPAIPVPTPSGPTTAITGITLDDVSDSIRPNEIAAIRALQAPVMARVVFDGGVNASYYSNPLTELKTVASIMGQIADSSDMKNYSVSSYQARAMSYVSALKAHVDVWEVGNEVNGNWLGSGTLEKIKAAYSIVKSNQGKAALTFFYMGEPQDPNHCIDAPGNDQFTWIQNQFQLALPPSQRDPSVEAMRLGIDYVLVSWYPDGCPLIRPDWTQVFSRLASIFPNSNLGFGEIGTQIAQGGSNLEAGLIQEFYPLAKRIALPARYIGGYFWWYFAEEMVPYTTSRLFPFLFQSIR